MLRLAAIHPVLQTAADDFEQGNGPDLPTSAMGALGKCVARAFDKLSTSERDELFVVVEELLVNPDEEVQDAVATGFLEGLVVKAEELGSYQDIASHFGSESTGISISYLRRSMSPS